MPRNQIYCCICGGPFFEPWQRREDESKDWLTRAIILTTAHDTPDNAGLEHDTFRDHPSVRFPDLTPEHQDTQRHVLQLPADYDDHNSFPLVASGEKLVAMNISMADRHLYLPVHEQCFQLAQRFMDGGPEEGVTSVDQLWEILLHRVQVNSTYYILPHPYDYYGGGGCRGVEWEPDDGEPEYGELLEASPIGVANLTEGILQNLQPVGQERPKDTDITGNRVTQEQEWWCETLANKKRLPWLWDLDNALVQEKQRSGNWDWELLVRQLSRPEIHEPSDSTLALPVGLRNRRRIWRCIEEARVDDTA